MHQDGVVAEWHERGYGFILFSDGRRGYVHHTSVSSTGPGPINLAQGELVKALVVEDAHNPGKWAALDVQRKGLIQGTTQLHTVPPQSAVPVSSSAGAASMVEGVVMEWNSRGFGFIQFQDGRRAYVHHTSIGGGNLLEGETVSAVVLEDVKNPGKWAAVDVHRGGVVDMAQPPAMHHMPVTMMPVQQQQQQQHHHHYPHHLVADHLIAAAPTDMSERIDCMVTEWSERGYGFLQTADSRRAYVHASAFGGGNLVKGENVNCIIVEDPQSPGKWQGLSLQRGSLYEESRGPAPASYHPAEDHLDYVQPAKYRRQPAYRPAEDHLDYAQPTEYRRQPAYQLAEDHVDHAQPAEEGVVIEWRREGGYGFLSMDDGRRVYIHHSCFGGGDLNAGQRLSVQTKPDSRNPGKWSVAIVFSDVHGCGGSCEVAAAGGGGGRGGSEYAYSADTAIGAPPVETRLPVSHNLMAAPVQTPRRPNQGQTWAYVTDWDLKGFGFVLTEDGRRVYVHHSAFGSGNLSVGERVGVTIVPDQRNSGKLMAQTLVRDETQAGLTTQPPWERCSLGPSPVSPPVHRQPELAVEIDQHLGDASATLLQEEDWTRGIVTEWHEERGYGFIELEDGRRLYIHHTAFGGGSLVQGAPCEAIPVPDKVNAGKLSAAAVRGDAAVIPRALGGGDPALKRSRIS